MVNNRGFIIYKTSKKKGKRHDYDIYKNNHPITPKQVINVFDLGYLDIEKDFPDQLYLHYRIEKIGITNCPKRKKSTIRNMLKRGYSDREHIPSL